MFEKLNNNIKYKLQGVTRLCDTTQGLILCEGRKSWTYRMCFLIRQTVKNNRRKK